MIHDISDEFLLKVLAQVNANGEDHTCELFGIGRESLARYMREAKRRGIPISDRSKVLERIANTYSDEELRAIANGGRIVPGMARVPVVNFDGEHIRVGAITDTHIGSKYFSASRLRQAFDEFDKAGITFMVHAGDVTEGMSHRPGHIYELDQLGYDQQKEYAVELFGEWEGTPIYMIDGNHDRWFIKSSGAIVVKDICDALPNAEFLGHDEGDISLAGVDTLKLWHGEDGNSYALSYRLQKILESLSGGEKPGAMICGHTHKFVNIFERNVHTYSVGSIQAQTKWMRGKRIAAHVGFAVIDLWVNEQGIAASGVRWCPFYT